MLANAAIVAAICDAAPLLKDIGIYRIHAGQCPNSSSNNNAGQYPNSSSNVGAVVFLGMRWCYACARYCPADS